MTPSWLLIGSTVPRVGGSRWIAPATVSGATGRANVTTKAVVTATLSPIGCVATAEAVVASRVRNAARAGLTSGCPDRARAPGWTVIVWRVPAAQWSRGAIIKTVPVASHASETGVGGSTVMAAATDAGSIAVLNRMLTGSVNARSVTTCVVNAAGVSGTIGTGAVATAGDGRPVPTMPMPTIRARPSAKLTRMAFERRSLPPTEAAASAA